MILLSFDSPVLRSRRAPYSSKPPTRKVRRSAVFNVGAFVIRVFTLSVGESDSSLSAASLQHLSAVRRAHSFSEAVHLASLTLFGLICSEHYRTSLFSV